MKEVLVLWLALATWGWAQPIPFRLPVTPEGKEGAEVSEVLPAGFRSLGKSSQVLTITPNQDLDRPRKLRIHMDGYSDQFQAYTYRELLALPEVSPGVHTFAPIVLVPEGSSIYLFLTQHKAWLLLGGLALGAWGLRSYTETARQKQRLAKMERYNKADGGDPMIGQHLDQYLVTHKLGSGGMATVYRAIPYDTMDESQAVAIKLIMDDKRDAEFFHRFRREVEVTQSLNHPNTLRLFGWGEQDGLFFLIMELVQGKPLCPPAGGFSLSEFKAYLPGLLAGLCYAHERGIVHRDLKPDNLMVMPNGQIKIMDFGLARSHEMKTVTATGIALGTPAYMPPEQILGESPTPHSDQYSLGVTFYEMLCGRRPFQHEEMMALIQAQLNEEAMPLSMYREDISLELEQVVMQMLCKQPERRFRDLKAVQRALQEAFEGI